MAKIGRVCICLAGTRPRKQEQLPVHLDIRDFTTGGQMYPEHVHVHISISLGYNGYNSRSLPLLHQAPRGAPKQAPRHLAVLGFVADEPDPRATDPEQLEKLRQSQEVLWRAKGCCQTQMHRVKR